MVSLDYVTFLDRLLQHVPSKRYRMVRYYGLYSSYHLSKIIGKYLEQTGTPADLPFKLHDFGFRGVSSVESAGIGGAAHLVNFQGTDTLQALQTIRQYYNTNMVAGFAVPASEHSTMTSWGESPRSRCL